MKRYFLFITCCVILFSVKGQINYPEKIRLTDNWLFLQEDIGNIWEAVRPYSQGAAESVPIWKEVKLPHCYNEEDAVDPDLNYYQGPAWYKTTLKINNPYKDGRTILHFEGAGQKTDVYVYMTKVASHVGGYDEWSVDITDAVGSFLKSKDAKRFKGKIPLSIRCDNSRDAEMIPSDLSDFNVYGGIYRYLNLVYLPAVSIQNLFVDASVDNKGKMGKLNMKVNFNNPLSIREVKAEIIVLDPSGKQCVSKQVQLNDLKGEVDLLSAELKNPILWHPDAPNLYTCEVRIITSDTITNYKERIGFRNFEFVKNGPFLLNGKRLLLRGTHRHEDHAGVGAALTEEMIIREMEMMKEMGVNFIRLGHYQQSRIVLEQCDKLGILVWEEIPWCRGGLGGNTYQEQAKRMLTNMIIQHRNHPSIILWGMGNENDWPNDFPEFDKQKIRAFMKTLHDLSHTLDDTRKTCIRRCDFCKDIIDVYSPSIWAGWYRGVYTDYKKVSLSEMKKVDHFLHVEWGGDSHARRHAEDPFVGIDKVITDGTADERAGDASLYGGNSRVSKDGEWSESYICELIDWHLKEQETMDWLTGAAYWPFKDFSTPLRPENPVPYVNQKGVVERDFTPKESYYVFQSYWANKPMIHIYGHSWPVRWGDKDEKKSLRVYSNCEEVELFLNGTSLGIKKRNSQDFPASGLRWESSLLEGKNSLKAIGKKKEGKSTVTVTDEVAFDYQTQKWGKEAQVSVRKIEETLDYVWVEAVLIDKNSIRCLDSKNYIYFGLTGDGQMIQNQGTSSGSRTLQAYNGRAKIKIMKNGGNSVLSVKSPGLKTVFLSIQ